MNRLQSTLEIKDVFCFTDSTIVLAWLHTPTYLLQTFVANRVQQVLEITNAQWWHHVRGEDNPADVGSRGTMPSLLKDSSLWWSGPEWCTKPLSDWPTPEILPAVNVPELKPTTLSLITVNKNPSFLTFTEKYSSLIRLLRVLAYMRRFIHNSQIKGPCKSQRVGGPLSPVELSTTKQHCIKVIQHHFYPEAFSAGNPNNWTLELRKLAGFVDGEGLLRVGGRLHNALMPDEQRHPILLPSRSHFTTLIVDYHHQKNHHAGPTTLLASIRQEFWIPAARNLVKLVKRKCITCVRFSKQTVSPLMGSLPASRFQAVRPFLHTGVDFAGPFMCREALSRRAAVRKSYLCIFICMASRAVHLELALGMSVTEFLDVFDRFVSRRGLPAAMYSDCGTNFVGTAGYLKELEQWFNGTSTRQSIINQTSHLAIQWKFNPPLSPHFGGGWEAAVKSAKAILFKAIGNHPFTCWELSTMFSKVECILNSRPLQPVSDSPDDLEALTPGHFIVGHPLNALPDWDLTNIPSNRLTRWQLIRERIQFFWHRWNEEYVRSLQQRNKWIENTRNLQVGDLVLVKDSTQPAAVWPLARISKIHPGPDEVVRVVTLKTAKGTYKRPTVKLIPLHLEPL